MKSISITLGNEAGLHARPAHLFVSTAQSFKSTVSVIKEAKKVDGKSILAILTLGVGKDTEITIEAEGSDEQEAIDALVALIENNFGE